jgi:hypothetical protein
MDHGGTTRHNTHRARSVDVDTIIESIFSANGDARLPQPVPLSQMIDLLVDFWVRQRRES